MKNREPNCGMGLPMGGEKRIGRAERSETACRRQPGGQTQSGNPMPRCIVLALVAFAACAHAQETNSLGMKMVPVPGTKILMATTEVTVDQYKAAGLGYEAPKFAQSGNHPAVNVSWNDAKKYCAWLSKKEGKKYRLPTDREWSCAVGLGDLEPEGGSPGSKAGKIPDVFPWGSGKPGKGAGNYRGQEWRTIPEAIAYAKKCGVGQIPYAQKEVHTWELLPDYSDGYAFTAPVGSYSPNSLGIYDLGGNVEEWCEDKYRPMKAEHVARGGSWWLLHRHILLSSARNTWRPEVRVDHCGFRVVCEER